MLNIIIIADIFGITPAFESLVQAICVDNNLHNAGKITMIGPYASEDIRFTDENDAYAYFTEHVGLKNYTEKVAATLDTLSSPTLVIGFSVGGSAVWCLSAKTNVNIMQAICFYSGQVRHHTHVKPLIPITLILPLSEPHFCITSFACSLQKTPNVALEPCQYLHGFMNKQSINYVEEGYQNYVARLRNVYKNQC